ncbi:hypothetical protein BOTBODRAFT_100397 [Botryobasidium botryosum FD-172 SS1]|uniref:MYND-type domain-containing protein n=1 Tax=Botryobasidium botryosum (strain FD-172 SS1) TaxID=930990 RepID=A0A067MYV7_BOTB1|nr:hypothetical protein BOTBODRAFT_100397 [Botryobasidium botryosum FD-172 SS1]
MYADFELRSSPLYRSSALVSRPVAAGSTILRIPALSAVLLPEQKGLRCDTCFSPRSERKGLSRCTGCHLYWYCSAQCQAMAWRAHHKRLCRHLPSFVESGEYDPARSLESLLLMHLIAEHFSSPASLELFASTTNVDNALPGDAKPVNLDDPLSTLLSLLPHPAPQPAPPLPRLSVSIDTNIASYLSARAPNNHFTLHDSYLTSFAHGIFPAASRSFNHSCVPTAVAIYEGTIMQVKTLVAMQAGEEITLPYVDPAMPYVQRQETLLSSYGFKCACARCEMQTISLSHPIPAARNSQEYADLETSLYNRVLKFPSSQSIALPQTISQLDLTSNLQRSLEDDTLLPRLSSTFSDASHDGQFNASRRSGLALLAVYVLIYPQNYPLIGLHCLELAKTWWNEFISSGSICLLVETQKFLRWAEEVLMISGSKGEGGGDSAWESLLMLQGLVQEELRSTGTGV